MSKPTTGPKSSPGARHDNVESSSIVAALKGGTQLGVEAVLKTTELVSAVHGGIQHVASLSTVGRRYAAGGIAGWVYRAVGGVTRAVGFTLDNAFRLLPEHAEWQPRSVRAQALLSALNGVVGDHLAASGNPLAIPMQLLHRGLPVSPSAPAISALGVGQKVKLVVLLHGLCMNPQQWRPSLAEDCEDSIGEASAPLESMLNELGYSTLYLRYNSGRHIGDNGAEFSRLIQSWVDAWPNGTSLTLIGHSMGGLVARGALAHAERERLSWLRCTDKVITLGTPHDGAPLERAGNGVDRLLGALPLVAPFARLGKLRSAGITDLRHGSVLRADGDRFVGKAPAAITLLPKSVKLYVVAGSRSPAGSRAAKRPRGDGLVPVASALGEHRTAARSLAVPAHRQGVLYGLHHLALMHHPEAVRQIRLWLEQGH